MHPDYTPGKVPGVALSGDVTLLPQFGLTARSHLAFGHGIREFALGAGPEFTYRYKRVRPYLAGTIGYGHFSSVSSNLTGNGTNSFVISYIAGVDVRVSRRLSVRVLDVDYSSWVHFLPNGLTPMVYSSGFTYRR